VRAVWQTLLEWLPDLTAGTFEIRDALNLLMTGVGAGLAAWAIVLGRRQARLAERQAAIVEAQNAIFEQQLAKRSELRLFGARHSYGSMVVLPTIQVENVGTKSTDGFYWGVYIPRSLRGFVSFADESGEEVAGRFTPLAEDELCDGQDGYHTNRLFPFGPVEVTRLYIRTHKRTDDFTIKWRLVGDDGPVPSHRSYGVLRFKRRESDGVFETSDVTPAEREVRTD
jgi:hypothetical protein